MQTVGTDLPQRGTVCPKCGVHIPQFAELSDVDASRIRQLIANQRATMAMQELRSATGCPIAWAKIWVQHRDNPDTVGTTAPCPYCGKPLITALAKQCRYCLMDWHEPQKPKKLGAA
jgi:predicted RNA-binding Zn-ribbon protein involved in translation (DUF1610 family)